jgi:uracil-DNA glycosylase family protein
MDKQDHAVNPPPHASIERLRDLARVCRGCELWRSATQTVFGRGPAPAKLMLVGEQPGSREDRAGLPFVGPAGGVLQRALTQARIDPAAVYITNAVKHFKWVARGKLRIHKRPNRAEVEACRPWLDAEIRVVKPRLIVCLGATAAEALLGPSFRLTQNHGRFFSNGGPAMTATLHPSAILRGPTPAERERLMAQLVADLQAAADRL